MLFGTKCICSDWRCAHDEMKYTSTNVYHTLTTNASNMQIIVHVEYCMVSRYNPMRQDIVYQTWNMTDMTLRGLKRYQTKFSLRVVRSSFLIMASGYCWYQHSKRFTLSKRTYIWNLLWLLKYWTENRLVQFITMMMISIMNIIIHEGNVRGMRITISFNNTSLRFRKTQLDWVFA